MIEKKLVHPTEVCCREMDNGGAIITASAGYNSLYERAYSDPDEARSYAATLFSTVFEIDVIEEIESDF